MSENQSNQPTADAVSRSDATGIQLVIARGLSTWMSAPLYTARIYAEALVTGAVAVMTDADQWERLPAATGHAIHEEHEASGSSWTLDAEEWQIGIQSLHGLAHGVIEHNAAHDPYGEQTPLCKYWYVSKADLKGTDLTLGDIARAFGGDVLAAANTFLHACDLLPLQ
jgi:hypothetical protein